MSLIQLIARRIKTLRANEGLTQLELAEASGISFKFYQQLESGKKKQIWLETVERLAAAYGVEAWQLIGKDEPVAKLAPRAPTSSVHHARKPRGRASKA